MKTTFYVEQVEAGWQLRGPAVTSAFGSRQEAVEAAEMTLRLMARAGFDAGLVVGARDDGKPPARPLPG